MILYDLTNVKSSLEFLTYEGEVKTSLSIIGELGAVIGEYKVNEFPQVVPFEDVDVWYQFKYQQFEDVKSPLYLYLSRFDINSSIELNNSFVEKTFNSVGSWYTNDRKEEVIRLFHKFFRLNRIEKGFDTKANERDFYKFIKHINSVRDFEEFFKTFDYIHFW